MDANACGSQTEIEMFMKGHDENRCVNLIFHLGMQLVCRMAYMSIKTKKKRCASLRIPLSTDISINSILLFSLSYSFFFLDDFPVGFEFIFLRFPQIIYWQLFCIFTFCSMLENSTKKKKKRLTVIEYIKSACKLNDAEK